MTKDLQHVLRSAGLDDKEAALYLAGLRLGSSPASAYAAAAAMNRITAYNTLEALSRRGMFTVSKHRAGKAYAPVAPEYLAVEARKNAGAIDRALPELRSLMGSHYRSPHVRFYEGWEGVRAVYEDTLTAHGELLNFANSAVVRSHWPAYDAEYVEERVKRKIRLRGIAPDDATGKRVRGEDKRYNREIRLVPAKKFDFRNEIKIYDNKVAIVSFPTGAAKDEMFGVIIESREVAETQRQIFEMAWAFAGSKKR